MMQDKVVRIRDMAKGATLPPPRLQLNDAETKQYAELRQKPAEAGPTAVEPPLDKLSTEDQKAELWAIVQPFLPIAVGSELDSSQEEIAVWYLAKKLSTTPLGDVPRVCHQPRRRPTKLSGWLHIPFRYPSRSPSLIQTHTY